MNKCRPQGFEYELNDSTCGLCFYTSKYGNVGKRIRLHHIERRNSAMNDTQPEKDHKMILAQLGWELPPQSPPRITQKGQLLNE